MKLPSDARARRMAVRSAAVGAVIAVAGMVQTGNATSLTPSAQPPSADATPTSASTSVTLSGEGASDPSAELKTWQNDLYGNSGAFDLNYLVSGGYKGRQDLLAGTIDYAISGVGFGQDEPVVGAPIMASGLGVLATPPADDSLPQGANGGHGFGTGSEDSDGDAVPGSYAPYSGPLKVPAANLAAMLLGDGISTNGALDNWSDTEILSAMGLVATSSPDANGNTTYTEPPSFVGNAGVVLRSDPSESNYYTLLFAQSAAPSVFSEMEAFDHATFPVSDVLPPALDQPDTRQGLANQLTKMFSFDNSGNPVLPPIGSNGDGGEVAPVQPSALNILQTTAPKEAALLKWINVQNANGEWEQPSPQTITAGVAAGGDTPFYGLNHIAPGAYPLTYVDYLYAPNHGLSVDKTEAVATLIRYLVTDGQTPMTANNDGTISSTLKAQALAAANQVVIDNCTGSGAQIVVSTDPGRFAPSTPGIKTIGSMLHCDATSSPASTGSPGVTGSSGSATAPGYVVPSATGSVVPDTSAANDIGAGSPSPTEASPAEVTQAPPSKPGGGVKQRADGGSTALTLASLPISLPFSSSNGFDRFTALLLGAALFFAGRRVVSWLIRLARP